jgi:ribonuclease E
MKEEQLREDQRREALARKELEPHGEETLPPPATHRLEEPAPRREEPAPQMAEPAPQVAEPAPRMAEPVRVEPPQPRIDPKALLESAGLVMIETDRSKAPPQAQVQEEPPHLGRPRRERPKPVSQEEELKQVETRK